MKLKFDRDEAGNVTTILGIDGQDKEFQYHVFIERMFDNDAIEVPEYSEKISEEDRTKINSMVEQISTVITKRADADAS